MEKDTKERKVPCSSVEREVQGRSRRLGFDERHVESCSPSSTTRSPGDAVEEGVPSQVLSSPQFFPGSWCSSGPLKA